MAKKITIDEEIDPSKFVQEELLIPADPNMIIQAQWHPETGEQVASAIGKDGKEYPDPVPIAPPLDYAPPPDLMTMIKTMIFSERMKQLADQEDFDSIEEADDFDIEDDPADPLTPYERHFEPPPEPPAPRPEVGTPPAVPAAPQGTAAPPAGVSSPPPATPQPATPPASTVPPT